MSDDTNLPYSDKLAELADGIKANTPRRGTKSPYSTEQILTGLALMARGFSASETAEIIGCSNATAAKWRGAFRAGAIEDLAPGITQLAEHFDYSQLPEHPLRQAQPPRGRSAKGAAEYYQRALRAFNGQNPYRRNGQLEHN